MRTQSALPFILIAIACILFPPAVFSQDKPAENIDVMLEKFMADKKLLIAKNMALTETEAKAFWPVYNEYQGKISGLSDRSIQMLQSYASGYEAMTDEAAGKILVEYLSIEKERLEVRKEYLPKFRSVLPEKKVLRLYQIENKIHSAISFKGALVIPLAE